MDMMSEKLDFGDDESCFALIESLITHECNDFSVKMMNLVLLEKCNKPNKKKPSKSAFKRKNRKISFTIGKFKCLKKR